MLITDLVNCSNLRVVERDRLNAVLDELKMVDKMVKMERRRTGKPRAAGGKAMWRRPAPPSRSVCQNVTSRSLSERSTEGGYFPSQSPT